MGRIRRGGRALVSLAVLLLLLVLSPPPASAHAVLVRSDPAAGSVLADPPDAVRLWFSEDVAASFTSIHLVDGAGRTVPGTRVTESRLDPRAVELVLPPLRTGTYAAVWTVLAEDDGHATSGVVAFRVGGGRAPAAAVATTSAGPSTPTLVGLRWRAARHRPA